jgi:Flp pilus assembly protein TadD
MFAFSKLPLFRPLAWAVLLALGACTANPPPPSRPVLDLNIADAAIAGGDPQMALQVSQSVLATDPQSLAALDHEGAAYYALGRCMDAIAAYQLALATNPNSADAELGIGRCLLRRDAAAAEAAFAAAVRDDPGNAAAFNDLGIARDLQGNHAGAVQPYQRALLLKPGAIATEVNLGLSLALAGDANDALQYLGPLAASSQTTEKIREDYATALIVAGRPAAAKQVLAIDLPADQVNRFVTGIAAAIATPRAPPAAPAAASPTTPIARTQPVTATPLPPPMPVAAAPPPPTPTSTSATLAQACDPPAKSARLWRR